MRRIIFIALLFTISQSLFGQLTSEQEKQIDDLKQVIKTADHDSIIINAWTNWDDIIYISDPQLDLELNFKIDSLSTKNLTTSLNHEELQFFLTAKGRAVNILGVFYSGQGDHIKAFECFMQGLKIREKIGDQLEIAKSLNNIGIFYQAQNNLPEALKYYEQSLEIYKNDGDKYDVATSMNNIGLLYEAQTDYSKALVYLEESLLLSKEIEDIQLISTTLNNIGIVYRMQELYPESIEKHMEALIMAEENGDKFLTSKCLYNLGFIYEAKKDYNKAIEYTTKALKYGKTYGFDLVIRDASYVLWRAYKNLNRHKEALEMHELFITTRDIIHNDETQKELMRVEYEKQAVEDSLKTAEEVKLKDAELTHEKAELALQKKQSYYLYAGLLITIVFGGFIFNRFKITQKQKGIIADKMKEVDLAYDKLEIKSHEITDSIRYAKRIQTAILPPKSLVKEFLPQSFIFYKPKDIVAGDFYWLEHIEGKTLFAACDCTGHGVPGAMVSVVCNNSLNRSVREYGLTDPGKVLDKTREIVIQEFEKSEDVVKDGMDIALCSLEKNELPDETFKLSYSGANNPLWILRKGSNEVEEIRADKQPIGKFAHPKPYVTHTINLDKEDNIYIFSDGFSDQFGDTSRFPKGKKYKAANFKKFLFSIQNHPMDVQLELLTEEFDRWKGDLEQLDDVCIIGVKV